MILPLPGTLRLLFLRAFPQLLNWHILFLTSYSKASLDVKIFPETMSIEVNKCLRIAIIELPDKSRSNIVAFNMTANTSKAMAKMLATITVTNGLDYGHAPSGSVAGEEVRSRGVI